jgi:hypothetical protein
MDDIFYKEGSIPEPILKEFCETMLASPIASSTFVAMFDSCSIIGKQNNFRKKFYKLSRYIDKQIVYKASKVEIFKRYDKEMNNVFNSKNVLQRAFMDLRGRYRQNSDIFDFSLLNSDNVEVEMVQNHKQSYQFDPANLMI